MKESEYICRECESSEENAQNGVCMCCGCDDFYELESIRYRNWCSLGITVNVTNIISNEQNFEWWVISDNIFKVLNNLQEEVISAYGVKLWKRESSITPVHTDRVIKQAYLSLKEVSA